MGKTIADVMPVEPAEPPAPKPIGQQIREAIGETPFQAAVRQIADAYQVTYDELSREAERALGVPIWRPRRDQEPGSAGI